MEILLRRKIAVRNNIEMELRKILCGLLLIGMIACLYAGAAEQSREYEKEAMEERKSVGLKGSSIDVSGNDFWMVKLKKVFTVNQKIEAYRVPGMGRISIQKKVTQAENEKPEGAGIEKLKVTEPVYAEESVAEESVVGEKTHPASVTVRLYGNGGAPEVTTITQMVENIDPGKWTLPRRLGKVFTGWYEDPACTILYSGGAEITRDLDLYAGWEEFEGFTCDDRGYITWAESLTQKQGGILVFPANADCVGIAEHALDHMGMEVEEVYIPENIKYIAPGVFDHLEGLMYIEAAKNNPNYYSEGGILYHRSGEMIACPSWMK